MIEDVSKLDQEGNVVETVNLIHINGNETHEKRIDTTN